MKVKKMGWFILTVTFGWAAGITLAPFGVYVKEKYLNNERTINHESIHWKQQMEMLIIFFYLWYLIEWLIRLPINGKQAYNSLAFEREAYGNADNLDYLKTRKHYAWIKNVFKK
jgi:hypothetical protein